MLITHAITSGILNIINGKDITLENTETEDIEKPRSENREYQKILEKSVSVLEDSKARLER